MLQLRRSIWIQVESVAESGRLASKKDVGADILKKMDQDNEPIGFVERPKGVGTSKKARPWMTSNQEIPDEESTVLLAQSGDRAAFSQLVESYDRRLLYFVRRILGEHNLAFDVLQVVWLTVFRRIRDLKSARAFRVWLYRIAHDTAVSEIRKTTRGPLLIDDLEVDSNSLDQTDAEAAFDNAELVHIGLQRLSVDHRLILTLRFLEDMKLTEIAEVLGCSEGTVKSRLFHARRALQQHIEELQND